MSQSIPELLQIPMSQRDTGTLQSMLQRAIELELSTLPVYLSGLWSITDQSSQAYSLINSVVLDEMLHLGLACNMMNSIGGTPSILGGFETAISYPGGLPGKVRPDLTVYLAGLSREYIYNVYMQIEYPEGGPIALTAGGPPTIGAFYDQLLETFNTLNPTITGAKQVTTKFDSTGEELFAINSMNDVVSAITEIKDQGEGTTQSPDSPTFTTAPSELAHYYKFAEIYNGKELIQVNGTWQYAGDPVPFPSVIDVPEVPKGGYPNPSPEVAKAMEAFNSKFAELLSFLDKAWATGNSDMLNKQAINTMFKLPTLAQAVMAIPLPNGQGYYGPDFILAAAGKQASAGA